MKYYLVNVNDENKIMKVEDESTADFLEEYNGKIIVAADSIQEILMKVNESEEIAAQVSKASEDMGTVEGGGLSNKRGRGYRKR